MPKISNNAQQQLWVSKGKILAPDPDIWWMSSCTGTVSMLFDQDSPFSIYIGGRDANNRGHIGRAKFEIAPEVRILSIEKDPILTPGDLGGFDENGVSYPCVVRNGDEVFLYYTGWMPSVLTPFQVDLGLAVIRPTGRIERYSRAAILPRSDDDPFSIGSCFVMQDEGLWRMWYTSVHRWKMQNGSPRHYYTIKYAESSDGIQWDRKKNVCIPFRDGDYAIGKPWVIREGDMFHMWYCYRGDRYAIGYAYSSDGKRWTRADDAVCFQRDPSDSWDAEEQSYPAVFPWQDTLYLFYCGNGYGRSGLGIATCSRNVLRSAFV